MIVMPPIYTLIINLKCIFEINVKNYLEVEVYF